MTYNPEIHHRRSVRLKDYDYTQPGLYFITVCTRNREHLFGTIPVGAGSKPARNNTPIDDSTRAGLEPAPTNTDTDTDMDADVYMKLNDFGRIVENSWFDLVYHVRNIKLHAFIVMPNHIHGIIEICDDIPVGAGSKPAQINTPIDDSTRAGLEPAPTGHGGTKSISEIVRQFKTFSSRRINKSRNAPGVSVWQRNYHEHIVRNENSYLKISGYIVNNPANWRRDTYYD